MSKISLAILRLHSAIEEPVLVKVRSKGEVGRVVVVASSESPPFLGKGRLLQDNGPSLSRVLQQ